MDFFARQDKARRHTGRLRVLFVLAVVCIIAAVHFMVGTVVFYTLRQSGRVVSGPASRQAVDSPLLLGHRTARTFLAEPKLVMVDAGLTLAVILCGVGITRAKFLAGGRSVAESCGGRLVDPSSRDPLERRLLNVVEEMSIASGVPVPPVFVLEDEDGINAFAAGRTTSDAAVAVTRGALEQLTRDELQGVVGHEFSHILNGDMRLNIRLAAWLGGIMGLALIGYVLLRLLTESNAPRLSRSSRDHNKLPLVLALCLIGLCLLVVGYIGVFFGRLIQAAVSRQREFLADASSVQFTRNPQGLADALKKIAGYRKGSALRTPHASMLRHMFFSNAAKPSWLDFAMASHPPIEQRIQWLDPAFNSEMAKLVALPRPAASQMESEPAPDATAATSSLASRRRRVADLPAQVGAARREHLEQALAFVGSLSAPVVAAARDPHGAPALVYALLLSDEPALRARQLQRLKAKAPRPVCEDLAKLEGLPELRDRSRKLPSLDLALAGLRRMNRAQFEEFKASLDELIASDGYMDLFEFTLKKVLNRHLGIYFGIIAAPAAGGPLLTMRHECMVLLSCLARQGHMDDPAGTSAAYRAGWRELLLATRSDEPLAQDDCKLDALGLALDRLNAASFPTKKRILTACASAVSADGEVRVEEAELLRAVSDTLDCPMPMMA